MGYLSFWDPERIKLVSPSNTIEENEHISSSAWLTCLASAFVRVGFLGFFNFKDNKVYLVIGAGLYLILSNRKQENQNFEFINNNSPPKSIELIEKKSNLSNEEKEELSEEEEKLNK